MGTQIRNKKKVMMMNTSSASRTLTRGANAWVPSEPNTQSPEAQASRQLLRALNQLAPDSFAPLSRRITGIVRETPALLADAGKMLFHKAVDEPLYAPIYAQLCRVLEDDAEVRHHFRRPLLRHCQAAYKLIKKWRNTPPGPVSLFVSAVEAEVRQRAAKRRMLGNIKLMGELFNHDLLSTAILSSCIRELLQDEPLGPLTLECLCHLLETTGSKLFRSGPAVVPEALVFARIAALSQAREQLSLRVCFMFQNLLELRDNNWTPLRPKDAPAPICSVHEQVRRDRSAAAERLAQPRPPAPYS
jgi:translation initiation factor 4G